MTVLKNSLLTPWSHLLTKEKIEAYSDRAWAQGTGSEWYAQLSLTWSPFTVDALFSWSTPRPVSTRDRSGFIPIECCVLGIAFIIVVHPSTTVYHSLVLWQGWHIIFWVTLIQSTGLDGDGAYTDRIDWKNSDVTQDGKRKVWTKTKAVLVGHDTRRHKNNTWHKIKYFPGGQGLDLPGTLYWVGWCWWREVSLMAEHSSWPSLNPVHEGVLYDDILSMN